MSGKYSVSWNVEKNFCQALTSLQQNGQFVDMTLAADGYFVKVHQLIISLASSYLKELVTSAQCPHPVVFLNQVSYSTLCQLLEYIYSGEVHVEAEDLDPLIEAGKALGIKGIQDMDVVTHSTYEEENDSQITTVVNTDNDEPEYITSDVKDFNVETEEPAYDTTEETLENETVEENETDHTDEKPSAEKSSINRALLTQYTLSNQGSLQIIVNRFIYFLKYTTQDNVRQWRCVDYVTKTKCPAFVISKGNEILKRVAAHHHTYHDSRIMKKIRAQTIFSELKEAEDVVKQKQSGKAKQESKKLALVDVDMEG